MKKIITKKSTSAPVAVRGYSALLGGVSELLESARRASARVVNAFMTATYWEIGRRIVEFEQGGERRAEYGEELLKRLAQDLSARLGRGFSRQNLQNMRLLYLSAPPDRIRQTLSGKLAESEIGRYPRPSLNSLVLVLRKLRASALKSAGSSSCGLAQVLLCMLSHASCLCRHLDASPLGL